MSIESIILEDLRHLRVPLVLGLVQAANERYGYAFGREPLKRIVQTSIELTEWGLPFHCAYGEAVAAEIDATGGPDIVPLQSHERRRDG